MRIYKKITMLLVTGMLLAGYSQKAEEEETSETIVVEESTIETEEEKDVQPVITEGGKNSYRYYTGND